MRILILGDINSSHIQRWASAFADKRYIIGIFSLSEPVTAWYKNISQIELRSKKGFSKDLFSESLFSKLNFIKTLAPLKGVIKNFKPDIIHAHYASSYGLLGALTAKNKPLVISAWGSDIYHFPNSNLFSKNILRYNLNKARCITSASNHLAKATRKFTKTRVEVVPFGIDTNKFSLRRNENKNNQIVIGAIKALELTYGIDILIRAFAGCKKQLPKYYLKLLLVGEGSQLNDFKELAQQLGVINNIEFAGKVSYDVIQESYHRMDIFANLSRFESFGVSVLEASSCGIPSVISDAGGLCEVGRQNETCLFVQPENIEETTKALIALIIDKDKRQMLGMNARNFVETHFTIQSSTEKMERVYDSVINK